MAHELRVGQYHFFITQLPYVSPLMFRLATQQNGATRAVAGAEKSAFAWCAVCGAVVCVCVGGVWWWCVGEGRCSAVRWGGAVLACQNFAGRRGREAMRLASPDLP